MFQVFRRRRCSHCRGNLCIEDGEVKCLQCGRPEPAGRITPQPVIRTHRKAKEKVLGGK